MKLSKLLNNMVAISSKDDCDVKGLSLDSRTTRPGDLFIAYPGSVQDGREYITEAIAKGASCVIAETIDIRRSPYNVPCFYVKTLQSKIAEIAARFYHYPAQSLEFIGITGTNGKSSCAYFISQLFQLTQLSPCAMIGTIGIGHPQRLKPNTLTTPGPIQLQHVLHDIVEEEFHTVAMEVSSHALSQGRINGLTFKTAIFTNLTRDHLDYHGTMTAYGNAKKKLFIDCDIENAVINIDDPFGKQLRAELSASTQIITYSLNDETADLYADNLQLNHQGLQADIDTPWGKAQLNSPLIGRFNLANLLASMVPLLLGGVPLKTIIEKIKHLQGVPGRMQLFAKTGFASAIVDYAHTPDALENALQAVRETCSGQLWCVFGCGGNRDQGKRSLMGRIAEQHADQIIITNDNPRFESPEDIINQILLGIAKTQSPIIIPDREQAIAYAIQQAKPHDMILVAGKGHENYQIINDQRIYFSDAEVIQAVYET